MITYWSKLINGKDKKYAKFLNDLGFKLSKKIEETLVGLKIANLF